MFKKPKVWRGLTAVCALFLVFSMMAANIFELYRTSVDAFFGTRSQVMVTSESDDAEDAWTYQSDFTTAQKAYEGFKEFAIRESQETYAMLKNDNDALPIASDSKITLFGIRSYAPVYGNNGGSTPDGKATVEIFDAFAERGGAGGAQDVHIYLHKGGGFMREFKFSLGDETRRQGVKLTEV